MGVETSNEVLKRVHALEAQVRTLKLFRIAWLVILGPRYAPRRISTEYLGRDSSEELRPDRLGRYRARSADRYWRG